MKKIYNLDYRLQMGIGVIGFAAACVVSHLSGRVFGEGLSDYLFEKRMDSIKKRYE